MDFSSSFLRKFLLFLFTITIVVPTASAAPADDDTTSMPIADYGFPRCYTSYPDYDTAFVEGSSTTAFIRPLEGHQRFPYEDVVTATSTISTTQQDCDALQPALIALGPHWSAIGLTRYEVPTNLINGDCKHCLPSKFDQQLIVASHGSWNRDPYIGYNLHAYNIKLDDNGQYQVQSQSQLLPPMRNSDTGIRIRPVDVRTYVGDGALLMTADRDDTFTENSMGGGLYRIRKKTSNEETNSNKAVNIPLAEVNARGENPAGVVLERLLPISCARQIAPSPNNPQLLYISTFGGFCPDKSAGDKIWVVALEPKNSVVARFAVLIDNLNGPQGIDAIGSSLYIATQGDTTANQGNCVLEIETVDRYAELVLSGGDTTNKQPVANAVVCGFTRIQQSHSWRTLRVHPSGEYAVVSIGADCNWPCEDNSANNDLQTTLVRVNLFQDRGSVAVIARGIRNAIGLWFDSPDHLLFTSFGSDRAAGIPGATSANNVPDCTVEVLNLGNQTTGNNEEGDAAAAAVQATGRFGLWLCHIIVASWIVLG